MATKKGVKRAVPSALNGAGNAFSIAWVHA
jgi:hypothetical protein